MLLVVLTGISLVGLTSCGSPSVRGILRLPVTRTFQPDPARVYTSGIWEESLIYSGLFKFDQSMNVVPDLAVALPTPSPDGTQYVVTLRAQARFADGHRVTARDVSFSFARALSRQEHSEPAFRTLGSIVGATAVHEGAARSLAGIHILGNQELRISLVRPDADFLDDLALPAASVLDPAVVSRNARWWLAGPGSGPFQLSGADGALLLTPNRHYYGGRLGLKSLELVKVRSAAQALDLFHRHKLDATQVSSRLYAGLASSSLFTSTDSSVAFYLLLRGVQSRRIRVALDEALQRSVLGQSSENIDPTVSLVPQTVPGYAAVPDPYTYQPQMASLVLRRTRPLRLSLADPAVPPVVVHWVLSSWRAAGLAVRLVDLKDPEISVIGIHVVLPQPQPWLEQLGRLARVDRYPSFQALLGRATQGIVADGPQPAWAADNQAERYLFRRALVLPIGIERTGYLVASRAQGLQATALGLEPVSENWATVTAQ